MGLVLEKKIQELETQLTPLLVSPASHELESTGIDIQAKFGFLNNLLAREMEINSQNKPEHLDHVACRLALLEAAFHNWNNNHESNNDIKNNDHYLDDVHDDDNDNDLLLKAIIPDCSCTHSCLIDDDVDEKGEEVQEEENDKDESDEKKFKRNEKEEEDDDDGEKKEVFEKNQSVKFGRFGAVVLVVVVVVIAVVMKIWMVEEEDFFVPT